MIGIDGHVSFLPHVGDVEGIHEGRALRQRQGKPGSAGWLGPFSGAGTHKAT